MKSGVDLEIFFFSDFSNSKAGKTRKKSRRKGMILSRTEQKAIEGKAKQALDKLVPK